MLKFYSSPEDKSQPRHESRAECFSDHFFIDAQQCLSAALDFICINLLNVVEKCAFVHGHHRPKNELNVNSSGNRSNEQTNTHVTYQ